MSDNSAGTNLRRVEKKDRRRVVLACDSNPHQIIERLHRRFQLDRAMIRRPHVNLNNRLIA
jgi:hypothetical protein